MNAFLSASVLIDLRRADRQLEADRRVSGSRLPQLLELQVKVDLFIDERQER